MKSRQPLLAEFQQPGKKTMRSWILPILLIFLAHFSYPSFAETDKLGDPPAPDEKTDLYRYVDLYGGTWVTYGEGSWEISFPVAGFTGRSKLDFEDIDSTMYMVGARVKPYFYFLTFDASYASGDIRSGTTIDRDWIETFLFSKSESDADGEVEYLALDLYVLLYPFREKTADWGRGEKKPPHLATLEGFFGWFHYEDRIDITNGFQTVSTPGVTPPIGPISGLDSEYDFEWEGLRTGLKYEWDFVRRPSRFLYALGVKAWAAYLWGVDYEGEGIWNLRTDFAQNPSFAHDANGDGFEGQIGIFYSPFKHFKAELAYRYLSLEAEDGTDTTFFSDGTTARTDLDEVSSERQGILFLLSFYF